MLQRADIGLLEVGRGVPVNALFYIADFDLVCVRTADECEGCVPRDDLKPILASGFGYEGANDLQVSHWLILERVDFALL